ncbi:DUF1565 domain-containing protein [Leptothoe kymatousa]|uniref:DUF1565 domain-containing protein n=1 Tax=Leptothoe kymatousa TAU-MAC 1615 TaxID=2364775 RepID=A0ABS5Y504_9CYAN|nr:DUF1565 domain-containing protein [Leptothoe kymatousa]MBT9312912.1 DUF1565 domain-containing protein [Leptothoe kymatousa TAU-MAC 1615]
MDATTYIKSIHSKLNSVSLGGLVLALATLLTPLAAPAQTRSPETQVLTRSPQPQNYSVLHVDAANGNDQQGTGETSQPYKTVTQALEVAPPGRSTVILLAPGHYSQTSGETFPLRLRAGITIQGSAGEARNTMIVGSGPVTAGSSHSATVVTAERSGLANVAISNPKGNGVWIEAGSPVLRRIALVSNGVTGIHVSNGAPIIENSYFNSNQNGLSIEGTSRAVVRGNYFEATGRAITITNPATPTINNNRIARNDVGIALKNNARPILEANILDQNRRNGVVEVDTVAVASDPAGSTPTAPEPAASIPTANIALPAQASAPTPLAHNIRALSALSNAPTPSPTPVETTATADAGDADTSVAEPPEVDAVPSPEQTASDPEVDAVPSPEQTTPDEIQLSKLLSPESLEAEAEATPSDTLEILGAQPRETEETPEETEPDVAGEADSPPLASDAIPIAVIPIENEAAASATSVEDSPNDTNISKLLARLNRQPSAPVNSSPRPNNVPRDGQAGRLPVPAVAIPSSLGTNQLPPPGTASLAQAFRYRILVDMDDADHLKDLVPDAFRTQVGRRTFMQAGAYVDEAEAQERLEWLEEHDIEARINVRD